jgi:hypothetical protein
MIFVITSFGISAFQWDKSLRSQLWRERRKRAQTTRRLGPKYVLFVFFRVFCILITTVSAPFRFKLWNLIVRWVIGSSSGCGKVVVFTWLQSLGFRHFRGPTCVPITPRCTPAGTPGRPSYALKPPSITQSTKQDPAPGPTANRCPQGVRTCELHGTPTSGSLALATLSRHSAAVNVVRFSPNGRSLRLFSTLLTLKIVLLGELRLLATVNF